jgi:hypothetical protein
MKQQKSEQLAKWRGLVSEQGESGQTVRAFCHDRGLRDSLFYDWKKRLREAEAVQFLEVAVKDSVKKSIEDRKPAPERFPAIEIRLSNGRRLSVEPGFDSNHLRALLSILETEA